MRTGDLPLDELAAYRSSATPPTDFADAWSSTLTEARAIPMTPRLEPVETGLNLITSYDLTFPGFAGEPVLAWLNVPAGATQPLPIVITYCGYGGGRGLPIEHLVWPAAGYAQLFMDTRGQGSSWGSGGDTADPHGGGPSGGGFLTRGIESFSTSYYRRLITDAVRAVDAARALPSIDPERVVVTGISQGGGLALAVAGLVDGLAAAMPDVPFLCDIRRAVDVAETDPYPEVARYLAVHRGSEEQAFSTLGYADGVHHAVRATAPAFFSVALADRTCPPSTVYAAYNAYAGPCSIEVYPFNDHEGGQAHQVARQLDWLRNTVGVPPATV